MLKLKKTGQTSKWIHDTIFRFHLKCVHQYELSNPFDLHLFQNVQLLIQIIELKLPIDH